MYIALFYREKDMKRFKKQFATLEELDHYIGYGKRVGVRFIGLFA